MNSQNILIVKDLSGSVTLSSNRLPRQWDECWKFSYEFQSGKVYAILGLHGTGGETITSTLSGNKYSADLRLEEGKIFFNDEIVNNNILNDLTCVLGEPPFDLRKSKGKTYGYILKEAIKKNKFNKYSFDEIIDKFFITRSRLDRDMRYLGNSVWESTASIGFVEGKKIFIFPYMNYNDHDFFIRRIKGISEIMKKENCIVIVITDVEECTHYYADEVIYIKSRFQILLEAIKEFKLGLTTMENVAKLFNRNEADKEEILGLINQYQEYIKY